MKKNRLIISAILATTLTAASANNVHPDSETMNTPTLVAPTDEQPNSEEKANPAAESADVNHAASDFIAEEARLASINLPRWTPSPTPLPANATTGQKVMAKFDPSLKFGGYIVAKYSINDSKEIKNGQRVSNGGFDLRFVRLYANGYCFKDFYYRFQLEVNGAPGEDKGPRIVDAFVEWQKLDYLRIKFGQFKRSFGFENPYSPLLVGMGSYSQATMKLASINDRIGEHKSSGRDLGVQVQGDLFKAQDGHHWFHYQVGIFNGQGINHADKDRTKDFIGGAWISPVKNLCIGGFGWSGRYVNEKFTDPTKQLSATRRDRWGLGLKYEDKWTVRGEYMSSKGGVVSNINAPKKSDAWYAMVGAPLFKNFKLYGRWDCYRDAKTWNSLQTNWGLSANYNLGKNLIFQANYTFTDKRGTPKPANHVNTFDLQVYARF